MSGNFTSRGDIYISPLFRKSAMNNKNRFKTIGYALVWLCVAGSVYAQSRAPAASDPDVSPPEVALLAFRVAPVSGLGTAARQTAVGVTTVASEGAPREIETRVNAGETWREVFQRLGSMIQSSVFSDSGLDSQLAILPAALPGKFMRVRASLQRAEATIDYVVSADQAYSISINSGTIQVLPRPADPQVLEKMRADPSRASLFTATDAIGLPETLVLQLTRIFGGDVDFHRDLHQGYRCSIVYEIRYRNGFLDERLLRILAVEFFIGEKQFGAYYFDDGNGSAGYYNETGKTTRKVFRKSPVEFSRVTSDYTHARFHPILGIWRAHRGIDYAAPMDTKVMAIADGVVEFVGPRGDYGNLVVLRHLDNRFRTYYGHLNSFAFGLAAGHKVEQGQQIGTVGMTGLATGPHLHFEFHMLDVSGNWIPVTPPDVLETEIPAPPGFAVAVERYKNQLRLAETTHFVTLD